MITLLLDASIWCHKNRLKLLTTFLLFILGNMGAKAQTAAGDVFTTVTYLPTTFGWVAPFWTRNADTSSMLSSYMQIQRAQDSIINMKATIDTKMSVANFTKAAMVAIGMMAYSDSAAMLVPYYKTPLGTTSQYVRGDGSISILPTNTLNVYDKSGLLANNAKIFSDTFSVASATPTISLSTYLTAMGASNFKLISATGYRASATVSNSPNVSVTSLSSNSVGLILNQINTTTVTILGISVLSGAPAILVPDPANVKVVLSFYAW